MAVTAHWYGNAFLNVFGGTNINFTSDTIKVALASAAYVPSQTHKFFSDITNEVSGAGYTAGGATLATPTNTYDGTATHTLGGAAVSWSSATLTARYAILYKSTGVATTSPLIGYIDFGASNSSVNGTYQITWAAAGITNIVIS